MRAATCLTLLLGACSGPAVVTPLAYAPTHTLGSPDGAAVLAIRDVVDARHVDPRSLGSAQGDVRLPTLALATPTRIVDELHQAFAGAMLGRGLLAPIGRQHYDLSVRLVRLHAGQLLEQVGTADFVLTVHDHATGRTVYTDEVTARSTSSQFPSLDSLAFVPTADVTADTQRAMNQAIDTALDKPAFRAAVRG